MLIHLKDFAGLIPKASDRSIPANHASLADNAQLYSSELRGYSTPLNVADLSAEVFTVKRAYRLYDGSTSVADAIGDWVAFDEEEINFIRGSVKNDQYDRYYASGGTLDPVVDTAANWAAGGGGIDLGVPAPTVAPTVASPAAGATDETRAYVYTFVNEWGEESAPSPASVPDTGDITGTWVLSGMQTAYPVAGTFKTLDRIRIYRTVTGTNSVNYRLVTEISTPAATYNDVGAGTPDADGFITTVDSVSLNESLPSLGWTLPPAGLQGIVNMANGMMVGFVGRDLYFSEPYRPHTFPIEYVISVDSDIVGLGVYQSGVVVCTAANPFVATGSSPLSITLTKLDDVEPCLSFRSIVNGLNGVTYASLNGLVLVNQSGAVNVISPIMTRNEWRNEYFPASTQAASDGDSTVAFYSLSSGYVFSPREPLGFLVDLVGFTDVQTIQTDPFTGEAYIISRDQVLLWNPTDTGPLTYSWKSKVFELPYPVNMGAYILQYEDIISGTDFVDTFSYGPYNTDRILTPLNCLNLHPINGVEVEPAMADSPPVVQNKSPIGGSPLYKTGAAAASISDGIRIQIWADSNNGDGMALRYDRTITTTEEKRLPSGFKADKWQIKFTSAQNIYSFKMAETGKEIAKA